MPEVRVRRSTFVYASDDIVKLDFPSVHPHLSRSDLLTKEKGGKGLYINSPMQRLICS